MRAPVAADGMSERDSAAIHIELVAIKVKLAIAGQNLRGKGLIEFDQVEVGDSQAVFFLHLFHGRDRTDAHDARVNAGGGYRDNAGQRLQVVLLHEGSLARTTAAAPSVMPEEFPAVIVPSVENTGDSLASFSKAASAKGCSSRVKTVGALLAFDGTGTSLVLKAASGDRSSGAGLRSKGELVLFVARDLVLLGQDFGGFAHDHFCHRAEEAVAIHAVHQFLIAEAITPTRAVKIVREARHGFGAAGEHTFEIAGGDFLVGERNGFEIPKRRPC